MKKIILFVMLVIVLVGVAFAYDKFVGQKSISIDQARAKAEKFINENLIQSGTKASIKNVVKENGLYKIAIDVGGQEFISYLTLDGKKFIPQEALDIESIESKNNGSQNQAQAEVPKSSKPQAELFVMSFCPYGVQAESSMIEVVNLLKDKADIKIRYIADVTGDTLDSIQSLHGIIEAKEDVRQLCVAKNYNNAILWNYIKAINKDCYPIYNQGEEKYDVCWKKAASGAGIDAAKIDSCISQEGLTLIKAESDQSKKYSVSGSPTLVINGVVVQGDRTAEGFKKSICSAFETVPEECAKTLSSTSAAASGNCQ